MSAKSKRTQNRNVFITGAASGIGREMALDFYLRENCNVLLLDHDDQGLGTLQRQLKKYKLPQTCDIYTCDLTSTAELKKLVLKLKGQKIDILINNAGVFYSGTFANMQIRDFEHVLAVDLMGTVRLTKALLPQILASEAGFIVNMASLAGLIGAPGMCAYAAAKFAVVGFSQSLAAELKGQVGVCVVCPAFVKTGLAANTIFAASKPGHTEQARAGINGFLERFGSAPHKVSREVIRAIQNNREQVLVNAEAFFLYYLHKFLPHASSVLVNQIYKWLIKAGALQS